MGIKQRREREKQAIQQSILSAARQIAVEEGWRAVTTRKVAERIEYSQPTIYEYFENKEAILLALVAQGFERLCESMQLAKKQEEQPEMQLFAMLHAYWSFAFSCPELYRVMHGLDGVSFSSDNIPTNEQAIFALLQETLLTWMEVTRVTFTQPSEVIASLWGCVHGLITLLMAERISLDEQRARLIMEQTVVTLLHAWPHQS